MAHTSRLDQKVSVNNGQLHLQLPQCIFCINGFHFSRACFYKLKGFEILILTPARANFSLVVWVLGNP